MKWFPKKALPICLTVMAISSPACAQVTEQQRRSPEKARSSPTAPGARAATGANPVLPGDHPDPSIMRVGDAYYTTSTSGDWAPEFALYRSTDLHHWTPVGAVFPQTPAWAKGDFWAPELVHDRDRIAVYYVARNQSGVLCVAVATAEHPEGPYTDHGPIECQPDGSIDPAFARDEHGTPYLLWKEDGNSQRKPTPIWAQPLTPDLVHLTGKPTELIENQDSTWEGGVVEAPFVLRHDGHFFLFYAGNACCGTECHYAEGVARADHLLGPWTKDPANPVIRPNAAWKCPGHGSAVQTPSGEDYLIYHAYPAEGTVYVGRESVLDRITWNADGWPEVNGGQGPGGGPASMPVRQPEFRDNFTHAPLDPEWKWPIGRKPEIRAESGHLILRAPAQGGPVFLGRSLFTPAYQATVQVGAAAGAQGGLGVIGGQAAQVVLSFDGSHLELWRANRKERKLLWQGVVKPASTLWLDVRSDDSGKAQFGYSADAQQWTDAGPSVNVRDLIPWDQGLRIGLVVGGASGDEASFSQFSLISK